MNQLKTGVAYHGNRILKHVEEDMIDIVRHNMNTVVHMFTHNDWDRHLGIMKDVVQISKAYGLEVWIDNWGIGGPPGDKSHFLQYHPESHIVRSDGKINPVKSCYNSEAFVCFTKEWLETVRGFGGEKIFWDEPSLGIIEKDGKKLFTCRCDTCQRLFKEKYDKPMPTEVTKEVLEFRNWTLYTYFDKVTAYAKSLGMENAVCIEPHYKDVSMGIINVKTLDDFGLDPYWNPGDLQKGNDAYTFVYKQTKELIAEAEKRKKNNHVWIQCFYVPASFEDEIITATDAAYDAGARTILDWSFRGAESNTYKCQNCERVWQVMGEAMQRIRSKNMDEIRKEKMALL